jgi:N-acetylglutamate synthase-like GNAT family acetyltransferase
MCDENNEFINTLEILLSIVRPGGYILSGIKLRKIEYSDKERIHEMTKNIWRGNDYIPGVFEELVKDSRSHFLGIEEHGKLIALANLYLIDESSGWLEALRVDPELTGKGWGKKMVQNMCRFAIDKGFNELFFSTYYRNKASINLNEKLGFMRYETFTNLVLDLKKMKSGNDYKALQLLPFSNERCERVVWNDWFAIPEGKKIDEDRFPRISKVIVNENEFLLSENHKERTILEISPVKISIIDYNTVKAITDYAVKNGYKKTHLMLATDINLKPLTEYGFNYREKTEDVYLFTAKTDELKLR